MSHAESQGVCTRAVHGGLGPDPVTGAILTPIYQSTTYVQEAVGQHNGHTYSRASNPTVTALEANLGSLENAGAACFATGLAAEHALFLATLQAGDHVVASRCVYGGTVRLLRQVLAPLGVSASFVDTRRSERVAAAIQPNTRLIFSETPANPTLSLSDIGALASLADAYGIPLGVDNTFLTPVGQTPLDLGAHVSVYSTTKHIEGHNSTVGGALVTRDEHLLERLKFIRKTVGSIQTPFEAWLTLRGLKTLPVRLRQHSENARWVADWLQRHPRVRAVNYPGLCNFPQRDLAERQHALHGGVLSFEVEGGAAAGRVVMNNVELCSLAENLGAVETLITHPATMTHADIPGVEREAIGIPDGLIRLSVGLEDPKDIVADLERAIARAQETPESSAAASQARVAESSLVRDSSPDPFHPISSVDGDSPSRAFSEDSHELSNQRPEVREFRLA